MKHPMIKRRLYVAISFLVASIFLLVGGTIDASAQATINYPGGTATTGLGPWGGTAGTRYPIPMDADAGPITLTVYDLNMSLVKFTKVNPCCGPLAGDAGLGAYAQVGIAGDTRVIDWPENGVQMFLTSVIGWDPITDGGGSWNNQNSRYTHDSARNNDDGLGYRKYLQQGWYNPINSLDQRDPWNSAFNQWNFQYNVEKFRGPYTIDPYDTFDLKLIITKVSVDPTPKKYRVEWFVRLHAASSWDESNRAANWGGPWNGAVNNAATGTADLENNGTYVDEVPAETARVRGAWYRVKSPGTPGSNYFDVSNVDFSKAYPHVSIHNGGAAANVNQTITWGNVVVQGTTKCTTDCYVDPVNGNDSFGGYQGYPLKNIQTAVNRVEPRGTVHLLAGNYAQSTVHVTKGITIKGESGAGSTIVGMSNQIVFYIDANGVSLEAVTIQNSLQGVRFEKAGQTIDSTQIRDVHFLNNSSRGIEIHNNTKVTNLNVVGSEFTNNNVGFRLASSAIGDGITITDSSFNNNVQLGFYQANDGSSGYIKNLHVSNCTFSNTGFAAVYAEEIQNAIVENSIFAGNARGVYIWKAYDVMDVSNITIRKNTFKDTTRASIIFFAYSSPTNGIVLSGNSIQQSVNTLVSNRGAIEVILA